MQNRSMSLFNAKLSRHLLKKAAGFTLIELLVVIVIVGVLSAIAVPTFLNQIRRSRAAEAESALSTAATGATVYAFDCTTYNVGVTGVAPAQFLNSTYNCGGQKVFKAAMDLPWSNLAPNFNVTGFTGDSSGGTARASGNAGAYTGVTCQKGAGTGTSSTDGCTISG